MAPDVAAPPQVAASTTAAKAAPDTGSQPIHPVEAPAHAVASSPQVAAGTTAGKAAPDTGSQSTHPVEAPAHVVASSEQGKEAEKTPAAAGKDDTKSDPPKAPTVQAPPLNLTLTDHSKDAVKAPTAPATAQAQIDQHGLDKPSSGQTSTQSQTASLETLKADWKSLETEERLFCAYTVSDSGGDVHKAQTAAFQRPADYDTPPNPPEKSLDVGFLDVSNDSEASFANNGFTSDTIKASASFGIKGLSIGASYGTSTQTSTGTAGTATQSSKSSIAVCWIPKARVFLGKNSLIISDKCKTAVENLYKYHDVQRLKDFRDQFGYIFATEVLIGGSMTSNQFAQASTNSTVESVREQVLTDMEASGSYRGASASAGVQNEHGTSSDKSTQASATQSSLHWTLHGGDSSLFHDMPAWIGSLNDASSWTVIQQVSVVPVEQLIDELIPSTWSADVRQGWKPFPALLQEIDASVVPNWSGWIKLVFYDSINRLSLKYDETDHGALGIQPAGGTAQSPTFYVSNGDPQMSGSRTLSEAPVCNYPLYLTPTKPSPTEQNPKGLYLEYMVNPSPPQERDPGLNLVRVLPPNPNAAPLSMVWSMVPAGDNQTSPWSDNGSRQKITHKSHVWLLGHPKEAGLWNSIDAGPAHGVPLMYQEGYYYYRVYNPISTFNIACDSILTDQVNQHSVTPNAQDFADADAKVLQPLRQGLKDGTVHMDSFLGLNLGTTAIAAATQEYQHVANVNALWRQDTLLARQAEATKRLSPNLPNEIDQWVKAHPGYHYAKFEVQFQDGLAL